MKSFYNTTNRAQMKMPQLQEKEIVSQILRGDETTLRKFYDIFHTPLARFIKRKIADEQDGQEILQDTLLATIEGLRDFSFRSRLFTYMCSIANHKIIDFYRKKKIKHVVFSKMADVEFLLSTLLGPEDALNEEILRVKIKTTFARIAPMYGDILKFKYVYGYSVGEIAQKLSISFKSAESQLFRARKAFVAAYVVA